MPSPPRPPSPTHRNASLSARLPRTLWGGEQLSRTLPTISYHAILASDAGVRDWLLLLHTYGIAFVHDTPATPEDTERLARRIAYIRPTHYGGFWDFTSDLAHADTAYTTMALGVHTDTTYLTDPVG